MSKCKLLMAKARAIADSIDTLGEKQRLLHPKGSFGEDYNRLHSAIEESRPDLKPLLPPKVRVEQSQYGGTTYDPFSEIRVYCEQMYQLLASVNDS